MEGCARWIQFLNEAFGNEKYITGLQEFFGSCLSSRQFGKMLIIVGPPASGKTIITNVLVAMVGEENVCRNPLSRFKSPFTRAEMSQKRVNVSEGDCCKDFKCAYVSGITLGDHIGASFKYKPPFIFIPEIKLVSVQQELPSGIDQSHRFFRRLLIVKLQQPTNPDPNLLSQLGMELIAIKAWAEEGLRRLETNGGYTV
jgi:putative DNA primase/helicase